MNYMQTINKMQAVLTELRREVQCGEAPKKGECVLCGFKHPKIHSAFGAGIPKDVIDKLMKYPDLPLHVRVAKTLGNKVYPLTPNDPKDKHWSMQYLDGNNEENRFIPDYPNDLVAAMGALEEYCEKNSCFPKIRYYAHKRIEERYWSWNVGLESHENKINIRNEKSLPQAICEAIVAHAEVK